MGGEGSRCPALMPLSSIVQNKMSILAGFFENGDRLLTFYPQKELHSPRLLPWEEKPQCLQLGVNALNATSQSRHHTIPKARMFPRYAKLQDWDLNNKECASVQGRWF